MSLFHAGLQPALDDDGNPISGATWNFYRTETLTAASVYSDASLGTSLGSTVTAGANGRFDVVFLNDTVQYRAILKDAGGSTIEDIDPVNPADTAPVSVIAFGATGDGVTDDSAAIQSALDSGAKTIFVPEGTYSLEAALTIPDYVTIEGEGHNSVLLATNGSDPWVFHQTGGTGFAIRNLKCTPDAIGDVHRAAGYFIECTGILIENVRVEGQDDAAAFYLQDCDYCTVDKLYFDGGATNKNGYAVYAISNIGLRVSNSVAINCNQGFALSGEGTDTAYTARAVDEAFCNSFVNCFVRNCKTHSFNANSTTHASFTNCHALDYAGASDHKAFQAKDAEGAELSSRGIKFVNCSAINYPAGFGAVRASRAMFSNCSGRDLSICGIQLTASQFCQFTNMDFDDFVTAGIWFGGTNSGHTFTNVKLQTSTATAKGIMTDTGATISNANFDNITTSSTLAAFIDISAGSTGNRFGMGCRSNDNTITDASGTSVWPLIYRTDELDMTSAASLKYGVHTIRGMQVAVAKFIATTDMSAVTGGPTVSAGTFNSTGSIAANQAVGTPALGAAVTLTLASQLIPSSGLLTARVGTAGSAGKGFVQFAGIPRQ